MFGPIHMKDVIVSINDVDTTDFTVEELTQMMKDTASRRRKSLSWALMIERGWLLGAVDVCHAVQWAGLKGQFGEMMRSTIPHGGII
jgi:hypothetical protein